jgi:hypothetical protein
VRHRVQVEGATYARVAGAGLWIGECVRLSGDQGRECDGGLAVRRTWVATVRLGAQARDDASSLDGGSAHGLCRRGHRWL